MHNIRFYEDHARIIILDDKKRNTILNNLLATNSFEEVVAGINELCVKFDPLSLKEEEIENIIFAQFNEQSKHIKQTKQHHFTIDFNKALDMDFICDLMEMNETQFQHWFLNQKFKVDMMGFQPGFAYMSHEGEAPSISRLDTPRSIVQAGSIGFLGKTTCIYAHDGPGGWPIIGRINIPIFNHGEHPPNLLQGGDNIVFESL